MHPKKDAYVRNGPCGVETSLDELLWLVVYNVDHRRSLKDLDWLPMGNKGSSLIENSILNLKPSKPLRIKWGYAIKTC